MTPDLVVFDCDGVLVDSEALVIEVEADLLTAAGFAYTADEICERFVGVALRDMVAMIEAEHGRPLPHGLVDRIRTETLAAFPHRLRPLDGIGAALDLLGPERCIASGSELARVHLSLDVTGLAPRFEPARVFSAQMVARGKPFPDLFLHAAERTGHDPERCVVIEDSPHGVQAARAAGMAVVGFVGGSHARPGLDERLREAGAGTVVGRAADLTTLPWWVIQP